VIRIDRFCFLSLVVSFLFFESVDGVVCVAMDIWAIDQCVCDGMECGKWYWARWQWVEGVMITKIFVVRRKYLVVFLNFFNVFLTEEVYLLRSNKQGMQKQIFER